MHGDDFEIAEQKRTRALGHPVQESPLGLPTRGEIPNLAGSDEHVCDAVAVEVADGEIPRRIGCVEGVGENDVFHGIGRAGDDSVAFGLQKNVVVNRSEATRRAALVDIDEAGVQKRIPTDVKVVTRETVVPVAGMKAPVHVNVVRVTFFAENEVVVRVVARPSVGSDGVRMLPVKDIRLIEDECGLARDGTIFSKSTPLGT